MKNIANCLSIIKNAHVRGSFRATNILNSPVIIKLLRILKKEGVILAFYVNPVEKKYLTVIINPDSVFGDALNMASLSSNPKSITFNKLNTWFDSRSPFYIISTRKGFLTKLNFSRQRLGGYPVVLVKYLGNANNR